MLWVMEIKFQTAWAFEVLVDGFVCTVQGIRGALRAKNLFGPLQVCEHGAGVAAAANIQPASLPF